MLRIWVVTIVATALGCGGDAEPGMVEFTAATGLAAGVRDCHCEYGPSVPPDTLTLALSCRGADDAYLLDGYLDPTLAAQDQPATIVASFGEDDPYSYQVQGTGRFDTFSALTIDGLDVEWAAAEGDGGLDHHPVPGGALRGGHGTCATMSPDDSRGRR